MMVVAVIPARYASQRLPGKPLVDICGKPMIQRVYEQVKKSALIQRVCVATDDERVAKAVRSFGGEVFLTSPELQSGTDRMAAVAKLIPGDIFVNVQGDEPMIEAAAIDLAIGPVVSGKFDMSTLRTALQSSEELMNLNIVKVIVDDQDRALYFSRYPIPYSRENPMEAKLPYLCSKHVGIYVFRRDVLARVSGLPVSELERAESLEQLRALKASISIGALLTDFDSNGVDTPADLDKVRLLISDQISKEEFR